MGLCIASKPGHPASVVLLTQSAAYAQKIAQEFLSGAVCYSNIRSMPGFTGRWNGTDVSVQGVGMGGVSAAMYTAELLTDCGAKALIKLDGCTALSPDLHTGDWVLAQSANSTMRMNRFLYHGKIFPAAADFALLNNAYEAAVQKGLPLHVGPVLSPETMDDLPIAMRFAALGTLAIDWELNQIYTRSSLAGVPAVGISRVAAHATDCSGPIADPAPVILDELAQFALDLAQHLL